MLVDPAGVKALRALCNKWVELGSVHRWLQVWLNQMMFFSVELIPIFDGKVLRDFHSLKHTKTSMFAPRNAGVQ